MNARAIKSVRMLFGGTATRKQKAYVLALEELSKN